jgi:hypothetical protein
MWLRMERLKRQVAPEDGDVSVLASGLDVLSLETSSITVL